MIQTYRIKAPLPWGMGARGQGISCFSCGAPIGQGGFGKLIGLRAFCLNCYLGRTPPERFERREEHGGRHEP